MNLPWNEQLSAVRRRLDLDQTAMGRLLGVSREWVSKLEKGKELPSDGIRSKVHVLAQEVGLHFTEPEITNANLAKPRQTITHAIGAGEARPSSQQNCEDYFKALIEAAASSGNPNAFPVIHDRLIKQFPLAEWVPAHPAAPPPGSIVITPDEIATMKNVVATEHARALKQTIAAAESRTSK